MDVRKVPQQPQIPDESIMVVKRSILFKSNPWLGILTENLVPLFDSIMKEHEFLPRILMENDPSYKQIIPYIIFTYDNKYFLMQRRSTSTEQRLRNKMSLGIGGHLRQEDCQGSQFESWAQREFDEEISYEGEGTFSFLGLINDDSTAVGKVHLGLVMLFSGTSSKISVKSELKKGKLMSLEECATFYDDMESWSQFVFDFLMQTKS